MSGQGETDRAERLLNSPDPVWREAAQAYLDGKYEHICVPYDLGGSCTQPHPVLRDAQGGAG